jgi:uncharacterized membrane protein HdeD (DUF308 family)
LLPSLQKRWRSLLLRGVIAVLVGIYALVDPQGLWVALAVLFAFFAICDGMLRVVVGWNETPRAWLWVAWGAFEVAMGLAAALWPGIALRTLVVLMGIWAVIRGLMEIQLAVQLRREVRGEGWLLFSGLGSVLLGLLLFLQPVLGLVAAGWLFGGYACSRACSASCSPSRSAASHARSAN